MTRKIKSKDAAEGRDVAGLLNTRTMWRGSLHPMVKTRPTAPSGKTLASAASKAARPVFKKYGTPRNELADIWPEIVGKTLADVTVPERYVPGTGLANNGVLTVRVAGAIALDLQHMSPQILERVNAYFGYNAVRYLKLVQGPVQNAGAGGKRRRFGGGDTGHSRDGLGKLVKGVARQDLRAALETFGRHIAKSGTSD